jgi:hypothetical protein
MGFQSISEHAYDSLFNIYSNKSATLLPLNREVSKHRMAPLGRTQKTPRSISRNDRAPIHHELVIYTL